MWKSVENLAGGQEVYAISQIIEKLNEVIEKLNDLDNDCLKQV
jgi:hypothetical protein